MWNSVGEIEMISKRLAILQDSKLRINTQEIYT